MKLDPITIIGLLAAVFTSTSFVPQVIKTIKTKQTKDISLVMYSLFCMGVFLWLIYGIVRVDVPVIIANAVTLSLAVVVLIMKIKNG